MFSSTTPFHPSACCACGALSPELGGSGRRFAKRLHVSLLLRAASSVCLCSSVRHFTWAVSFCCTAARSSATHAPELCHGLSPKAPVSLTCGTPTSAECCETSLSLLRCIDFCGMFRGFPASPAQVFTCSLHVRAFTLSHDLRLLCLLPRS